MEFIVEAFQQGGPWMYVILLADVILLAASLGALLVAVVASAKRTGGRFARIFSVSVALGCAIPAGVGALAMVTGNALTERASQAAHPDAVSEMVALGREVAMIPMKFGAGSALLLLLPAAAAFFLAPPDEDPVAPELQAAPR